MFVNAGAIELPLDHSTIRPHCVSGPKPAYTSATISLHLAYLVVASPLLHNALQSTSVAPVFNVLGPTTFDNGIHNPFSGPPSDTTLRWLES